MGHPCPMHAMQRRSLAILSHARIDAVKHGRGAGLHARIDAVKHGRGAAYRYVASKLF